jgi:hypothetical protein
LIALPAPGNGGNDIEIDETLFCEVQASGVTTCGEEEQSKLDALELQAHDVVKSEDAAAVYYVGPDAKKHLFISEKLYHTWHCSFADVKVVSETVIEALETGSDVTYRPGLRMIKLPTGPEVYAVENGAVLRWIVDEAIAASIYGDDWRTMIDDVASLDGYTMGEDIDSSTDFDPIAQEQSVTVPADAMDLEGYVKSAPGNGLVCDGV